jgi:hypothetical protein
LESLYGHALPKATGCSLLPSIHHHRHFKKSVIFLSALQFFMINHAKHAVIIDNI